MDVTAGDIRKLIERPVANVPVTSVYLSTDGARFPKASDYELHLDGLLREVRKTADSLPDAHAQAVRADADEISRWVRHSFEREGIRGLGVFSSDGEILETVQIALPFRNVARVNNRPYIVPLEAVLGRAYHMGLALVERDRADIYRYHLANLEVYTGIASDVHGWHKQGGWSMLGNQKNIEHEVLHHYKDVAEVLMDLHEKHPLDVLVIAGPEPEVSEFERHLHPYVQKIVFGEKLALERTATVSQIKQRLSEIEQRLVSARRAELLGRLAAAQGQAEKAARGIPEVLEAINTKRVDTLFVVEGAGVPGYRSATGALALGEDEAQAYGEPVTPVGDVIDEIIEEAVRSGAHIELFRDEVRLDGDPVAALLRF